MASWPEARSMITARQAPPRCPLSREWRQARAASPATPPGSTWLRKSAR
ncbi:hypothetical protein [Halomonas sp. PGE1]|nr:hypothetical protein [Halomonas sp. PGE1]